VRQTESRRGRQRYSAVEPATILGYSVARYWLLDSRLAALIVSDFFSRTYETKFSLVRDRYCHRTHRYPHTTDTIEYTFLCVIPSCLFPVVAMICLSAISNPRRRSDTVSDSETILLVSSRVSCSWEVMQRNQTSRSHCLSFVYTSCLLSRLNLCAGDRGGRNPIA
jgi:hypothetical protein